MIGKVGFAASLAALTCRHAARRVGASCAALVFSAALLSMCGCSRENLPDRMDDPAYVEQLNKQLKVQSDLVAQGAKILRELEAARAEDPKSEKTKELERRHAAISEELEKQRIVNMAIIRERKQREQADRAEAAGK